MRTHDMLVEEETSQFDIFIQAMGYDERSHTRHKREQPDGADDGEARIAVARNSIKTDLHVVWCGKWFGCELQLVSLMHGGKCDMPLMPKPISTERQSDSG